MTAFRIVGSGVQGDPPSVFILRKCPHPELACGVFESSPCEGAQWGGCRDIQQFNIAFMGKEAAFNAAVQKLKELNPRGAVSTGRNNPSLMNLEAGIQRKIEEAEAEEAARKKNL